MGFGGLLRALLGNSLVLMGYVLLSGVNDLVDNPAKTARVHRVVCEGIK